MGLGRKGKSASVALGFSSPRRGSFSLGSLKRKRKPVFDKTKDKVNTLVNDRVTAPIRTSIVISVAAFLLAGLALILVVRNADH